MKLWILSDWHLETRLAFQPTRPEEFDVLVCAGDVDHSVEHAIESVALLADGKPAFFVFGNHEWAADGRSAAEKRGAARGAAKAYGVMILEQSAIDLGGVLFAGATLWEERHPQFGDTVRALQQYGADVVITHFPPDPITLLGVLPEGGLWICGHHHGYSDTTFEARRLIRNAIGFANEPISEPAIQDLVIEVGVTEG